MRWGARSGESTSSTARARGTVSTANRGEKGGAPRSNGRRACGRFEPAKLRGDPARDLTSTIGTNTCLEAWRRRAGRRWRRAAPAGEVSNTATFTGAPFFVLFCGTSTANRWRPKRAKQAARRRRPESVRKAADGRGGRRPEFEPLAYSEKLADHAEELLGRWKLKGLARDSPGRRPAS